MLNPTVFMCFLSQKPSKKPRLSRSGARSTSQLREESSWRHPRSGRRKLTESNGFSRVWNGFSRVWNGFSRVWNRFSRVWNGFSRVLNGFSRVWNGFSRVLNGFSRVWNGFSRFF